MSLIFFPASGVGFTGFGNWWRVWMDWDGMDWTGLLNGPMWMDGGRWTMDDRFAHGRRDNLTEHVT